MTIERGFHLDTIPELVHTSGDDAPLICEEPRSFTGWILNYPEVLGDQFSNDLCTARTNGEIGG